MDDKYCHRGKENTKCLMHNSAQGVTKQLQKPSVSVSDTDRSTVDGIAAAIPTGSSGTQNKVPVIKVHVAKGYMKFNAAHFIAFKGFREKLHGHNYRLAVTITGQIRRDDYVKLRNEIKKASRIICKDLDESFLVPMNSNVLKISCDDKNVWIVTEDLAKFRFPVADCSFLPIVHSSAEELANWISNQLVDTLTFDALMKRGVRKMEVSISEADQQFAMHKRIVLPESPSM